MAQILHTQVIHKLTQVGMVIATRAPAPYIYALEINCKYIEIVVDTMRPSYIMNPSRQGRSERNT